MRILRGGKVSKWTKGTEPKALTASYFMAQSPWAQPLFFSRVSLLTPLPLQNWSRLRPLSLPGGVQLLLPSQHHLPMPLSGFLWLPVSYWRWSCASSPLATAPGHTCVTAGDSYLVSTLTPHGNKVIVFKYLSGHVMSMFQSSPSPWDSAPWPGAFPQVLTSCLLLALLLYVPELIGLLLFLQDAVHPPASGVAVPSPETHMTHSLTSFMSLLRCGFITDASSNFPVQEGNSFGTAQMGMPRSKEGNF